MLKSESVCFGTYNTFYEYIRAENITAVRSCQTVN